MKPLLARLYLLFDPRACARDPWGTLDSALAGGVGLVQWRDKGRGSAQELQHAAAICAAHQVPLVINDDPDLAVQIDAAGAHVGQEDLPAALARARLGNQRWLGVSTHDLAQIAAAQAAGADYVGFGPCFPTTTKGYTTGKPAEQIAAACAAARVPLFAIGGVTAARIPSLVACGVRRIAVSAAILLAADPRAAAATLLAALD